jgi:hypothetical protein
MSGNDSVYNDNPRITPLLRAVTAVECLVLLVAGVGLLFLPSIIGPEWPWELSPFNTLLLGAAYSSSLMAIVTMVYIGRWAPARIVVPMIFLFTAIVLVVSLAYLDRFDAGSYSTWVWFALYIVIPVNALYHMWLYRDLRPYCPIPLPMLWRSVLLIPIILLGFYGAGLLLAPETFSDFWPWPIDAFHGRVYSVLYMTPALGAILLWRSAASIELVALGLTLSVGGLVAVVGLPVVDSTAGRVVWSQTGTWLWVVSFALLLIAGLGLLWRSRSQEQAGN